MNYPRFSVLLITLCTLGSPLCSPVSGAVQNTDEIANTLADFRERYFVANNGKDKMLAIQSMRVDAELSLSDGRTGKIIYIKQKPNYVRSVWYGPHGVTMRRGFNGVVSWQTLKTADGKEIGNVSHDRPEEVFEWVIAAPESCGATLEMLPVERVERSENYHIRATFENGTVKDYFIDSLTFCETRVVETAKDGKVVTYVVEKPQKFDGIWFPGVQIEYDGNGKEIERVKINDVQMNIGLLPCFFDCPVKLQEKVDESSTQPPSQDGK